MPRLIHSTPKYRKHRASGQAIVTITGRDHYLGPHRSKASIVEYDRLIAEWLANNRQPVLTQDEQSELTVTELLARYWPFAKTYYVKDGQPTGWQVHIRMVVRMLRKSYGHVPVTEFGPLALKATRQRMIDAGHSRNYINKLIGLVVGIFKWGASEELVPVTVHQALATVAGLRKGRSPAKDHAPVAPVPEADIQATLPHLPEIPADMLLFQRLTGARPGEVCILRPCDIDRTEDVWAYRPGDHKTEHHGRDRIIFVGPKAQAILTPYLLREADAYCFSPIESEKKRRAEMHANRKTPIRYGNRPGTNRKRAAKRKAGDCYTTDSYRRAIHRACELAGVNLWNPNQLRHSAGTEVRRQFGLEAAQTILGHAKADVTQVYAERDNELARNVMRQIG